MIIHRGRLRHSAVAIGAAVGLLLGGLAAIPAGASTVSNAAERATIAEDTSTLGGRVAYPEGVTPDPWAKVHLESTEGFTTLSRLAELDEHGDYRLELIPAGDYFLWVEPGDGVAWQWWRTGTSQATAEVLTIGEGEERLDLDFTLNTGAKLTGQLTGFTGEEGYVEFHQQDGDRLEHRQSIATNADGTWEATGLAPGDWVVFFRSDERQEYWKDKETAQAADRITLELNDVVGNIDADLSDRLPYPDYEWISVVFTGKAVVGSTVTATLTPEGWPEDTTFTYQWVRYVNDPYTGGLRAEPYPGATSLTLPITANMLGAYPALIATSHLEGYRDVEFGVGEVGPVMEKSPQPTIAGAAVIGQTLTADAGRWASDSFETYQWLANGRPISGATEQTYVVGPNDAGKAISVAVTGQSGKGLELTTETSPATARVLQSATPVVRGTAKVGKQVIAQPGKWTAGAALTYQWHADGKPIAGATKATYRVVKSLVGKRLTVTVTGKKYGFAPASQVSKGTWKVRP